MKWFYVYVGDSENVLKYLNKLSSNGVAPDCIKLASSSFGSGVYYYHSQGINNY